MRGTRPCDDELASIYQPPDGTEISLKGLGLQPFEFEVLEVGLVAVVEILFG